MKLRKILSMILCLAMLVPFASCAKEDDGPKKEIQDDGNIIDMVPEGYNLDGMAIGIFFRGMGQEGPNGKGLDKEVLGYENETDIVFSKIYERNKKVEARLNCKIDNIPSYTDFWADFCPVLRQNLQNLDDSFQVVVSSNNTFQKDDMFFNFQNLNDSNYINLDEEWWYKEAIMEISPDNYYYRFLYGDLYLGALGWSACIFYNKDLYSEYVDPGNPDGLYEHVFNGTWTIEQFGIESANSYVNMGDENKDIHGYSLFRYAEPIQHFAASCEAEFYRRDSKGFPTITVYNEKSIEIANALYKLLYNNKGAWLFYPDNFGPEVEHQFDFENRRVMFKLGNLLDFVKASMRDMEDTFGCLPYPKFNVEQEGYTSFMENGSTITGIPKIVNKEFAMEEVSAVLEAMGSEAFKSVKDAFYEQACKRAYSRDDTSAEMVDIITGRHPTIKSKLTNNFLNFYSVHTGGAGGIFSKIMRKGPVGMPNFASEWESIEEMATSKLNELIQLYLKDE